jgi:hypothetical protein
VNNLNDSFCDEFEYYFHLWYELQDLTLYVDDLKLKKFCPEVSFKIGENLYLDDFCSNWSSWGDRKDV